MFHSVEAKLERARDALAKDDDIDIVFKTKEKGRFYLNTSTEVGNNEGNAVISFFFSLASCAIIDIRVI